jgi:hypothetical protein
MALEESRHEHRSPAGFDLNVRAAWPLSRGEGILIAQGDDGMDLDHPDLRVNTADAPHYDFFKNQATGLHPGRLPLTARRRRPHAAQSDNGLV